MSKVISVNESFVFALRIEEKEDLSLVASAFNAYAKPERGTYYTAEVIRRIGTYREENVFGILRGVATHGDSEDQILVLAVPDSDGPNGEVLFSTVPVALADVTHVVIREVLGYATYGETKPLAESMFQ